MIISDVI